jgi:predicted Zn-dependent peptidase
MTGPRPRRSRIMALALALAATLGCDDQRWRTEPPAVPEEMKVVFPALECVRVGAGPRVCVVELPHSPIVALGLSLAVGARHDPVDAPGATEATLAAIFAASDEQGVPVLRTSLGELGGPVSGLVTAKGAALTTFVLPQHLRPALEILTDVAMMPQLSGRATLEARAEQCADAIEALGDPDTLASVALRRALLPARHPGALPALRTQICHERLDTARAAELVRRFIVPANVVVFVAGPVTTDSVVLLVNQLTAGWSPAASAEPAPPSRTPGDPTPTIVDVPGLAQTVITIGGLTRPGRGADDPALALALGHADAAVSEGLRRDLGATYSVASSLIAADERALWMITTRVDAAVTGDALNELTSRLRFLGGRPVDESQVFTDGVHELASAMRSFAVAVDAVRLLAAQHRAGAAIEQVIERARDVRAVRAEDVKLLLGETFAPAGAQLILVGDANALSKLRALHGARVVRPISILDAVPLSPAGPIASPCPPDTQRTGALDKDEIRRPTPCRARAYEVGRDEVARGQ